MKFHRTCEMCGLPSWGKKCKECVLHPKDEWPELPRDTGEVVENVNREYPLIPVVRRVK